MSDLEEAPSVPERVRAGRGFLFGLLGAVVLAWMWAAGNLRLGVEFHAPAGEAGSDSMLVALLGGAFIGLLVAAGARGATAALSLVVVIEAMAAIMVGELLWPAFEPSWAGQDLDVLAIAQGRLVDVLVDSSLAANVLAGFVLAPLAGHGTMTLLKARQAEGMWPLPP